MKRKSIQYPPVTTQPAELREAALAEVPSIVSVRTAKDQLSSLLEHAASGNEVIITSDGLPKAKLVPVRSRRQPFQVDWAHLRSMPMTRSERDVVREDRDGRS